MTVTSPAGVPGRRRHRRPQGIRQAGRRPGRQRRSALRRGRRVHRQPGQGRADPLVREPVRWTSGKDAAAGSDAQLAAVILNSGGANACTGPEGYQDTVTTAEHVGSDAVACRRAGSRSRPPG